MNKNQEFADELLGQKDYQNALQSYLDILRDNPNDGAIYQEIARCYYNLKKYDEAIAAANEAIDKDKGLSIPHLILAYAYIDQGSFETALAEAREAYSLSPESEEVSNCYGALLLIRGKLDEAISTLLKVVELHPNSIVAYQNLANAYRMKKENNNYIKAIRKLYHHQPSLFNAIKLLVAYQQRYALPLVLILFFALIGAWWLEIRTLLIIPSFVVIFRLLINVTFLVDVAQKEQGKFRTFFSSLLPDFMLGVITYGIYFILATK